MPSQRQLACFIEVARAGSIQEAARRLAITQPAASRRLRDLEAVLGVALFARAHRKLILTEAGAVFLRYAEAAGLTLRQGVEAVTGSAGAARPVVAIGALPTAAGTLVPAAAARLRAMAPHTLIRVETGASRLLLGELRAGRLDLIVGRMPEPERMRGLTFEHLYSDRLAFVARAGHPLAGQAAPGLDAVLAHPLILPPDTAVIRPLAEAFLLARGAGWPDAAVETTSVAVAASYLAESDAVWVISQGVARPRVTAGELTFLAVNTAATLGSIGITLRAEGDARPETRLAIDALKAAAAD